MIHALYHNPDGATPEYISEGIQFQGEFLYSGDILFFLSTQNSGSLCSEIISC